MHLVFLAFKVSLLAINHSYALISQTLALVINSLRSLPLASRVVSSANKMVKKSLLSGISLINIRKSRGPSTLPCGTPILKVARSESTPSRDTNCCLL